jgi:quercetin dioxygenase-like cupin family protein
MKTKGLNAQQINSLDNVPIRSSLHFFDLPVLIYGMKNNSSCADGELNAIILVKNEEKQIVLTALPEGTKIDSFQSDNSIIFQVIEGKLRFRTREESVILLKNQLLTFHENIKYRLISIEETVFLLVIVEKILRNGRK